MSQEENLQKNNDLRLSVSKAKSFSDCRAKFNFTYNLKLPRSNKDYHIFGKFIHKILEDFHQEYIDGCKDSLNVIIERAFKNALIEFGNDMTADAKKEGYAMIDNYLELITNDPDTLKSVLSVEKNFSFHISENVVLNGMIDRIQMDKDGILHVADYKTTKNKKYLKNDFFQLLTYAYVLLSENENIEKVRGSYILLRHNFEYITKEFHRDEILKIKDKFEEYAKNINEEQLWRPNTTILCQYCEFLDICDSGKDYVRSRFPNNISGKMSW